MHLCIPVVFSQDVQIATDSLQPNEDTSLILDGNNSTCVTFNATTGQRAPWYSMLRVPVNLGQMTKLEVKGYNLGCDQADIRLYLSALYQPSGWTGVTTVCGFEGYLPGTPETCKYRCVCSTECDWLQIVRRPMSGVSPSWSLCNVSKYK